MLQKAPKFVHGWNGHFESFGRVQATEKRRQYLLLREKIFHIKQSLDTPELRISACYKTNEGVVVITELIEAALYG